MNQVALNTDSAKSVLNEHSSQKAEIKNDVAGNANPESLSPYKIGRRRVFFGLLIGYR